LAGVNANALLDDGTTPLHAAIAIPDDSVAHDICVFLVLSGANPNLGYANGWSAISYAESVNRKTLAETLLRVHDRKI
jgi:ankyrin repeat protein